MKRSQSMVGLVLLASIGFPKASIIPWIGVANAQVVPDGTVGTIVNAAGNLFTINNGTRSGNNLFHSFGQFSVPTGGSAIFNNAIDVQNIFSRVTGSSASSIDGLIKANGTASLFLMNPNGIVFGPKATLNIGGSFVGTTANSIKFSDGVEFSTVNPVANPLLTISVPIGLQMGTNPAAIQVQGSGHTLANGSFPLTGSAGTPQLRMQSGRTLALVGGPITFNGGNIAGQGGRIELGAIGSTPSGTSVDLISTTTGWAFNYGSVRQFAPIQLLKRSLINASGVNPGNIFLSSSNIDVADGSLALIENRGSNRAGDIVVNATDTVTLRGLSVDRRTFSSFLNYTRSSGSAGDILINARQVLIRDRAEIRSLTANTATGQGGDIVIRATDFVKLDNTIVGSNGVLQGSSGIFNSTQGRGNAGLIDIQTRELRLLPGFTISAASRSAGKGGTIQIAASELVEVIGATSTLKGNAILEVSSTGSGPAGDLIINTRRLIVQNGGIISASNNSLSSTTPGNGSGGKVMINATELVRVSGKRPAANVINGAIFSQISAASNRLTPNAPTPTGDSGTVTINTPLLELANEGRLLLLNDGVGKGGTLVVNADRLTLDNQAQILASTNSGTGGNVTLNLQELLLMRHGSLISAEALGNANLGIGGNITIKAPIILGLENSDIIANAVKGRGGNIDITTQGIIGLQFRNLLKPREVLTNDITASSEFNVNGNVSIHMIGINPTNSLNSLPVNMADSSRQLSDRCAAARTGSFVSTGRGGIPKSPIQTGKTDRPWKDLRPTVATPSTPIQPPLTAVAPMPQLVEASAIEVDETGVISLVAPQSMNSNPATCALWSQH
jgi:filamentous hemagglutinin family protein